MKINHNEKAKRVELMAKKQLEAQGYMVEKIRRGRFQGGDFFSCWDLIAVGKDVLFVQVSTKAIYNRSKEYRYKLIDFPEPQGVRKEYWQHVGKMVFRKFVIKDGGII